MDTRLTFVREQLEALTGLRIAMVYRKHDIGVELVSPTGLVIGETNVRITDDPANDFIFGNFSGAFSIKDMRPHLDRIRDEYSAKYGSNS